MALVTDIARDALGRLVIAGRQHLGRRHTKSGKTYEHLSSDVTAKSAISDGDKVTLYADSDGSLYVRSASNFADSFTTDSEPMAYHIWCDFCTLCQKKRRLASIVNMPEWASGPEWTGWRWAQRNQSVMRWTSGRCIEITEDEMLIDSFCDYDNASEIMGLPVEKARKIAEAIADADGGWCDDAEVYSEDSELKAAENA